MSSKTVFVNAFYEQIIALITELTQMYPDDKDFPMYIVGLKWFRTTNPSKPIKDVYVNTKLFEDKILAKDKDFFLNYSYDEYSEHIENDIFIKLKHYCQGMSENSMKNVWQYVVNITKLAKICSE